MIIPEVKETTKKYEGKIITIRADRLTRGDGKLFTREVAVVSDSVAVVAVDEHKRVLLIRQYRHPMGRPVWEIPAGRMDVQGEIPAQTALRELREEADVVADYIDPLTTFGSSVGFTSEKISVFIAYGLKNVSEFERQNEEADIEKKWVPFAEALEQVKKGIIDDSKTIIGIMLAKEYLQDRGM